MGPYPTKWDRTGVVIEVRQFDQYLIKVDGSNRSTLRNRKFLRQFQPVNPSPHPRSIDGDIAIHRYHPTPTAAPAEPTLDPPLAAPPEQVTSNQIPPIQDQEPLIPPEPTTVHQPPPIQVQEPPAPPNQDQMPPTYTPPADHTSTLRRSDRPRKPPKYLELYDRIS